MHNKPMVNIRMHQMNGLQRAAESLRFVLLCIEHWLSPEGKLRFWFKYNLRIAAWLMVPTVFILPATILLLWLVTACLHLAAGITGKAILFVLLLMVVGSTTALFKR